MSGQEQGLWALGTGLFPHRSVPMATMMDAWNSMCLRVTLQVISAVPLSKDRRSVLHLQSYLSLGTSPACSSTPWRMKVGETPVEAAGKPAVMSWDICLWLLNAPPAYVSCCTCSNYRTFCHLPQPRLWSQHRPLHPPPAGACSLRGSG